MRLNRALLMGALLVVGLIAASIFAVFVSPTFEQRSIVWSQQAGGVAVFPACGSASPSAGPVCSGDGTASYTLSWSIDGIHTGTTVRTGCDIDQGICWETEIINACSSTVILGGPNGPVEVPCSGNYTFTGLTNGTYTFTVQGADTGPITVTVNCGAIVPSTPTPQGYLDSASCDSISGWAYDPSSPGSSIDVHLYADKPTGVDNNNGSVGSYPANLARPDVNAVGIPGNHGFSFATPSILKDGQPHTLYLYPLSANGTTHGELTYSVNRVLQCTPTTPETLCPDGTPAPGGDVSRCAEPPVWTTYCTGGNDPNGNNWQWWQVDNSTPPNYRYLGPGDGACTPPIAPPILSATCDVADHVATFSWNAVPGATYYKLRVNDVDYPWTGTCTGDGNWCYGDNGTSLTTNSKSIPGLYGNYDAWVHACNASGCSAASEHAYTNCGKTEDVACTLNASPKSLSSPGTVTLSASFETWLITDWTGSLSSVGSVGSSNDGPWTSPWLTGDTTFNLSGSYTWFGIPMGEFACSTTVNVEGPPTRCPDGSIPPGGDLSKCTIPPDPRCPDGSIPPGGDFSKCSDGPTTTCKQPTTKHCSDDGYYITTYGADDDVCGKTPCLHADAGFKCVENGGDPYCPSGPTQPEIKFEVSPTLLHKFEHTTVRWYAVAISDTDEAIECTATGTNGDGGKGRWTAQRSDTMPVSYQSSEIIAQTTFTLECVGATTKQPLPDVEPITVNLIPDFQEI